MEAGSKKILLYIKIIFLCAIFNSFNLCAHHRININFDILLPMTWYQKCLALTIDLWHRMRQLTENDLTNTALQASFTSLLGRLAFGQFCVDRMMVQETQTLDEDKIYLFQVMEDVKVLIHTFFATPELFDYRNYLLSMLEKMQKQLC